MGADNEFLVFPCVQDDPVRRLPAVGSEGDCVRDTAEQVQIIYLLLIPSESSIWIQQLCNYTVMELLQLEKISEIFESCCY